MFRIIILLLLLISIEVIAQTPDTSKTGTFKVNNSRTPEKCIETRGGYQSFGSLSTRGRVVINDVTIEQEQFIKLQMNKIYQEIIFKILYNDSIICQVYKEFTKEHVNGIVITYEKKNDSVFVSKEADFEKMYAVNRFQSSETRHDLSAVNSLYVETMANQLDRLSNPLTPYLKSFNSNINLLIKIGIHLKANCDTCK